MPLRDHFHPPLDDETSWDGLHGAWPTMMIADLVKKLPPRYVAVPHIHLGASVEIDVAAFEKESFQEQAWRDNEEQAGGVSTATWAPPAATLSVADALPLQDQYEVRVYDAKRGRKLVAAVELVSPANKDRPESRRTFAAKCAALLQEGVSVGIVDIVTTRHFNLYGELLDLLGQTDPLLSPEPPDLYAVECRGPAGGAIHGKRGLQTWLHRLDIGKPLPTLPLWLTDDFAVPLDLEASYEDTCRLLRIS